MRYHLTWQGVSTCPYMKAAAAEREAAAVEKAAQAAAAEAAKTAAAEVGRCRLNR